MKIRKMSNLHLAAFATLILTLNFGLLAVPGVFAQCPDVAYWKLDEDTIGTYVDVIGGFDGDRANSSPEPAVDFKVGGAQEFNGQSTGIDIAADAEGDGPFDWAGNADFSIEFWLKREAGISDNEVVIGRQRGSYHWWAGLWNSGQVAFILIDSAGNHGGHLRGSDNIADGSWHHVAIVRDGTNNQHRLYVDGVPDSGATVDITAGTYTGDFASTSDALNIGWLNLSGGCCYFNGMLDEMAIHNVVLSDTQIATHFTNGDTSNAGYCGNLEPQIVSSEKTSGIAGFRYLYNVNATGEPLPSFSLTSNPDPGNMTIDTANGLIEWTPSTGGSFNVTVSADNGGTPATQPFTIDVGAVASCDTDLFAYWKLDEETIGTYVDVIGGFDGDRANRAPEPAVDFKVGGAQEFDGQSTGIDIAADAEGDGPFDWAGNADFSIEFWLKREAGISSNEVVIGRQRGSNHWWAGLWNSGEVAFILIDSAGNNGGNLRGSDNIADGSWHHVAIVRDGTNNQHRLYVDGVSDSGATVDITAGTYTGDFASTSDALNIGWLNYPGGCCYFNGVLDEVALFNKALDENDILQHFEAGDQKAQGYCQLVLAPTAVEDSGTVDEGGVLSVDAAHGVLENDSDPEKQTLTAILVSDVTNGSLTLNTDGSYTYTHDGSETTSDSFTYKANNGTMDSNTVAVTITVNPENDVPQISNGGSSIPTTVKPGQQYSYDFDVTDPDGPDATWSLTNNPTGMAIDTNGVVTWTPPDGTTSSGAVTVTVSDGTAQDSETFTITVGESSGGGGGGSGCFITSLNLTTID